MTETRKENSFTAEERKGKRLSRRFLGVVPTKTGFDKAHLKAYTKGKTHFRHGFETIKIPLMELDKEGEFIEKRQAVIHEVQQEYYLI